MLEMDKVFFAAVKGNVILCSPEAPLISEYRSVIVEELKLWYNDELRKPDSDGIEIVSVKVVKA